MVQLPRGTGGDQVTEGALKGETGTPLQMALPGLPPITGVRCLRTRPFPREEVSQWAGSMSVGLLSPSTRRRLLQGQVGPFPAPPSSSVAIFISSTVSGKGQGKAWVLEALLGGARAMCPLRDLDGHAAWPVTLVGTGEGEPRPSVSFLIVQADSLT